VGSQKPAGRRLWGRRLGVEDLGSDCREHVSVLATTHPFLEQDFTCHGEALSCLIICRLPFEVPDDPRLTAIAEKLKAEGVSPFTAYQLPVAVLRFRQGFGRLIRTATDRGVVCVLDRRILGGSYSQSFLKSLPKGVRVTTKVADIDRFFAGDQLVTSTPDSPSRFPGTTGNRAAAEWRHASPVDARR
jgi:hypothetical protein